MIHKIFNMEALEAWKDVDPVHWQSFVAEMLETFFRIFPQQYENLQLAEAQKDWKTVRKIAHNLKSSLGRIGAEACYQVLDEITMKSDDEVAQIPPLMQKLDSILPRTLIYISEYKRKIT